MNTGTKRDIRPKVRVVFKKDKESGEIVAVFPYAAGGALMVPCYSHSGQHSACSTGYLQGKVTAATETEYAPLLRELQETAYRDCRIIIKKHLPPFNKL